MIKGKQHKNRQQCRQDHTWATQQDSRETPTQGCSATHPNDLRGPVVKGLDSSSGRTISSVLSQIWHFANVSWTQTRVNCEIPFKFLPNLWNGLCHQHGTTERLVQRLCAQGYEDVVNTVLKSSLWTLRKAGCLFDSNAPIRLALWDTNCRFKIKSFPL